MPSTSELAEWDRQHVWHAFTQMAEYEPLIIERAEGCWLVDTTGRRYLDGVSSLWCNLHGHRHPRIDAAILVQLEKLAHATTLGASNPPAIELARRLAELSPRGLQHVFYSSDGACAVEAALKIAFQFWQQCPTPRPRKKKYIAYDSAYHGDTIGSTAVGGISRFHALFAPLLFDVIRIDAPDARFGDAETHLRRLESLLEEHHEEAAALVIEPLVQGAAGMVMQPPGYLRGVRELTTQYDVLLIADEIVTGFGRTGRLFACEHEGVTPDLLCLGKSLTAGYLPMAATLSTGEIYQAFLGSFADSKAFQHGHTYGGNPLAAAAALASLEVMSADRVLEDALPAKIEQLKNELAPLAKHPHISQVRQLGFLAGIELVDDRAKNAPYPPNERRGWQVCKRATENGVWLRPLGDVIVIVPPLSISRSEIEFLGRIVRESIEAACND